MSKVLTICIPTFNRKDVLIREVSDYLSVKDKRFCIKVSDNCSTDGTQEALRKIADERLKINVNKENIGSIPNWIKSLSENDSDYLLFTLDKDLVDIKQLQQFINYLEKEKPYFGYVDLDISKEVGVDTFLPGYDNILKMAYLDKHPSGYFYRRELFEKAIKRDSFLKIDPRFDFPFEIINAELALAYPSVIVRGGLIINASYRKDIIEGKTLSYDENNIWYGGPRRFVEFSYYIDSALSLPLSLENRYKLIRLNTKRGVDNVTFTLERLMKNETASTHYNVEMRNVGFVEMLSNTTNIFKILKEQAKGRLSYYQFLQIRTEITAKFIIRYLLKSLCVVK